MRFRGPVRQKLRNYPSAKTVLSTARLVNGAEAPFTLNRRSNLRDYPCPRDIVIFLFSSIRWVSETPVPHFTEKRREETYRTGVINPMPKTVPSIGCTIQMRASYTAGQIL